MDETAPRTRTYGFRINRSGEVYAHTTPGKHGQERNGDLFVGYVQRTGRAWKNDQCCTQYRTQGEAGRKLVEIVCH